MATQILTPSIGEAIGPGLPYWINPSNAVSQDGSNASHGNFEYEGDISYLRVRGFDSLPDGAYVTSLKAYIVGSTDSGSTGDPEPATAPPLTMEDEGPIGPTVTAVRAHISLDGSTPSGISFLCQLGLAPTSFELAGGLWGYAGLTTEDLGSPNFSVLITTEPGMNLGQRRVDYVWLEVVYTLEQPEGFSVMANQAQRQFCLLGVEDPSGSEAAANTRLTAATFTLGDQSTEETYRNAGQALPSNVVQYRGMSSGQISGNPTFDELPLLVSGHLGAPGTSEVNSSPAVYDHVFTDQQFLSSTPRAFTLEKGAPETSYKKAVYGIINSLGINQQSESAALTGSLFARQLSAHSDSSTMSRGAATVQTITITGTVAFKLRFRGQETASLSEASDGAAVQTALRALGIIDDSTALTATGSAGGPITVTFGNAYDGPFKGEPQPLLEVRKISGAGSAVAAITTVGGHTQYDRVYMQPGQMDVFLHTNYADLADNPLLNCFDTSIEFGERYAPRMVLESQYGKSYKDVTQVQDGHNIDINMTIEEGSRAHALLAANRADTLYYVRLLWTGPAIGSFAHECEIVTPVKVLGPGEDEVQQHSLATPIRLMATYDHAAGRGFSMRFRNKVPSY